MANIKLVKKTSKIVAFGENSRVFRYHSCLLVDFKKKSDLAPTLTNIILVKKTSKIVAFGEIINLFVFKLFFSLLIYALNLI